MEQNKIITKKNALSTIREEFGLSQEQLAELIDISPSTISRWERGKTLPPLLSAVSRKHNRPLTYVTAMVDQELRGKVRASERLEALFHGDNLMIVEFSKGVRSAFPLVVATIGLGITPFLRNETKRVFAENMPQFLRAMNTPGASCKWWAPYDGKNTESGLISSGLNMQLYYMGSKVVYMEAAPISIQESLERPVGEMIFEGI